MLCPLVHESLVSAVAVVVVLDVVGVAVVEPLLCPVQIGNVQ